MTAVSGPLEGAIFLSAEDLQAVWNNLLGEEKFFKALYLDPKLRVKLAAGGGGIGGKTPSIQNEGPKKVVSPPTTTAFRKRGPVPKKDENVDDAPVPKELISTFVNTIDLNNRKKAIEEVPRLLGLIDISDETNLNARVEEYVLAKWGDTQRPIYDRRLINLKSIIGTYRDDFSKNPVGRLIIGLSNTEIVNNHVDDLGTPNQQPTIAPDSNPNGDSALPLDAEGLKEVDAYLNRVRIVPGYAGVKKLLSDTEITIKRVNGPLRGDDNKGTLAQKKLMFKSATEAHGLSDRARAIYAKLMEDDNEIMRGLFAKHYSGVWGEISQRAENDKLVLDDVSRVGGAAGTAGAGGAADEEKRRRKNQELEKILGLTQDGIVAKTVESSNAVKYKDRQGFQNGNDLTVEFLMGLAQSDFNEGLRKKTLDAIRRKINESGHEPKIADGGDARQLAEHIYKFFQRTDNSQSQPTGQAAGVGARTRSQSGNKDAVAGVADDDGAVDKPGTIPE